MNCPCDATAHQASTAVGEGGAIASACIAIGRKLWRFVATAATIDSAVGGPTAVSIFTSSTAVKLELRKATASEFTSGK